MINRCASTVISRFVNRYTFEGLMKTGKFWQTLKTDFNKNLAYTNFSSISLNTTNFRRTTTPHKKNFETFFICQFSFLSPHVKQNQIIITIKVPHELSNDLKNEEILVKSRIHFWNSFFVNDRRTHHRSQNPQKSYLQQCNKPYDLKHSIISSFSKTGSKNSLLGKLLIDYIPSIAPSTSNIIARALNASNCSTSAGRKSIQAETKYYPLKYLLTQ